jgi:hypothetical protein
MRQEYFIPGAANRDTVLSDALPACPPSPGRPQIGIWGGAGVARCPSVLGQDRLIIITFSNHLSGSDFRKGNRIPDRRLRLPALGVALCCPGTSGYDDGS